MFKKMVSTVLIFSFLSFVVTPSIAFAETQEEKDASQQRAVATVIGLAALVGIWYMLSDKNSDFDRTALDAHLQDDKRFKIGWDFNDLGYYENDDPLSGHSKSEFRSPSLKASYKW